MLFISAAEVGRVLDVGALIEALAPAFMELSAGRASVPARIAARTEAGMLAAMPGYVDGILATKLVSVFPANHERGLPSHQALIAVFDPGTGEPVAVIDGRVITAVRTGAASALATRTLAGPHPQVLAIVGAGVQGASHLQAHLALQPWAEIRVASRNPESAARLASTWGGRAATSIRSAVEGADVVCLCTDTAQPVVTRDWLAPGAHVNSVGAGAGPEVDASTVEAAAVFVESRAAFAAPPAGTHELQGREPGSATELGEVLAGTRPGRTDPGRLTLYKSMGHAVEDAVAAALVLGATRAAGGGVEVNL